MIRHWIIVPLLTVLFVQIAIGQSHREKFVKLFNDKNIDGQFAFLQEWEKVGSEDPELYVSWFNHYFSKSRKEILSLTRTPNKGESIPLSKDGDDKVVAYLGSEVSFTKSDFDLGISYIDRGITKFPNRLDMRFGKTYALGQIKDFQRFKDEIVKAVEYFGRGNVRWLWREDKPIDGPKEFMLKSIQDYVVRLFEAGDEEAQFIKPIAEAILKFYPDHIESMSNLSVVLMVKGNFDDAIVILKKAEKLAPNDHVIVGNIAFCYYNKRDAANAKMYYERLARIGDERAKHDAAVKLSEIKGWN